ncbi:MAG: tetratricopeptide repeat protein [Pirellulales bacterium]
MATDDSQGPQPLPPAQRQRLQQMFDHASKTAAKALKDGVKSNFDYAHDIYAGCVVGDLANVTYFQALIDNLYKKFGGKKTKSKFGGWFGGTSNVGNLKKSEASKDWPGLIKAGLAALKGNPWDSDVLIKMAVAAEKLHLHDAQLAFLKGARNGNPKDPDVNRTCAKVLAACGRFDDAIECWRRVKEAKPEDPEADAMIGKLSVDKTIKKGKYDDAESTTDTMADKDEQAARRGETARATPEQKFRELIEKNPADVMNYIELADILKGENRWDEAEQTLGKAFEASGGDVKIRELIEDMQILRAKESARIAERQARDDKSEKSRNLAQQMKVEVNQRETEVFAARSERYPNHTGYRYELGVRLRRAANYAEAIKYLQQAKNDPKRKAMANFELGECFRLIKQYPLSIAAYEAALESFSNRDEEVKKQALYWAGKVALLGTKDAERAGKHLNALAGMDFSYKDLAALLDKLQQMGQN